MLVLTRKKDQQIVINLGEETVHVRILEVARDRVRLGITAPRNIPVHREEVAQRIEEERSSAQQRQTRNQPTLAADLVHPQ